MKRSVFIALAAAASAAAGALPSLIAATTWSQDNGDVFVVAEDRSVYHKYYRKNWGPQGVEKLGGEVGSSISAASWGDDRFDIFYLGKDTAVYHKFWDKGWGPSEGADGDWESLNGSFIGELAVAANGAPVINLFGYKKGKYYHRYWDGTGDWKPEDWAEFGTGFRSSPAAISWGLGRVDVFGITGNGSLLHRFYDGTKWQDWEKLGDGPFVGKPSASTWGKGRFDVWAVGAADHNLYHLYWQDSAYSAWENLGGDFATAPKVVSRDVGSLDILGSARGPGYLYKAFVGGSWYPDYSGFYTIEGDGYTSAPAQVSWHNGTVAQFVAANDTLLWRYWWGSGWYPEQWQQTWADLASLSSDKGDGGETLKVQELK